MAPIELKVVLIVCSDRAIQEALRLVVEDAGCRSVHAASVSIAQRLIEDARPILILVDPTCSAEAIDTLGGTCQIVEFPVRTSATGVRRFSKHSDVAVKWLKGLVEATCEASSEP